MRLTQWLTLSPEYLLWGGATILAAFACMGACAGWLGLRLGRRLREEVVLPNAALELGRTKREMLFEGATASCESHRKKVALLAVASLVLQAGASAAAAGIALLTLLVALFLWARPALRAMWWPRFWALTLALSLAAGWLLGDPEKTVLGLPSGVIIGLRMVMRGAHIYAVASWLTRAVRAEEMVSFWSRIGLSKLGEAVVVALQLLPATLARLEADFRTDRTLAGSGEKLFRALRETLAVVESLARRKEEE